PAKVNLDDAGHRSAASVAVAPDDRFFVAWNQQDQEESAVVVQAFNPTGQRLGHETILSSEEFQAGEQSEREREISAMRPAAGAIGFFAKDGTLQFQQAIEGAAGFWGSLGTSNFVFDPETLYDPLSGRFFAMASEGNAPGAKSYILIAISDDSDPNGTWYKY